jgi:Flp pilus assembly pilin Flp
MKTFNTISKQIGRLLRDERGQSTTEYILILSVVVMIAIKFKKTIGSKLDTMVNKLDGQMAEGMDNN